MNKKTRKHTNQEKDSRSEFLYVSTPIHTSPPKIALDYIRLWTKRLARGHTLRYVSVGLVVIIVGGISFNTVEFIGKSMSHSEITRTTTATIDPYEVLLSITNDPDTYVLFDLRNSEAYAAGHIIRALNVSLDKEELLRHAAAAKERIIVLYSHSQFAQDPFDAYQILSENGYRARVLAVGWNEWAHMNTLWIPDDQWSKYNISDYIQESSIEDAAL